MPITRATTLVCVGTSKHRKVLWPYPSPIGNSTRSLLFAPIRTSNGTAKGADSHPTLGGVGWGRGKAQRKQFCPCCKDAILVGPWQFVCWLFVFFCCLSSSSSSAFFSFSSSTMKLLLCCYCCFFFFFFFTYAMRRSRALPAKIADKEGTPQR